MSKTMILVAAATLSGGTKAKDGTIKPYEAAPGTELTSKVLEALGLDDDAVATLIERGTIAEMDVRAAEAPTGASDNSAALKAANARADAAESRVTELVADLAKATKPVDPAPAQ